MYKFPLAVLACYRLAQFVSLDTGPGAIFKRLRRWSLTQQARRGGRSLVEFLECPYCQGVWFAGALALWLQPASFLDWFVYSVAVAGGQAFLETLGTRANGNDG